MDANAFRMPFKDSDPQADLSHGWAQMLRIALHRQIGVMDGGKC